MSSQASGNQGNDDDDDDDDDDNNDDNNEAFQGGLSLRGCNAIICATLISR